MTKLNKYFKVKSLTQSIKELQEVPVIFLPLNELEDSVIAMRQATAVLHKHGIKASVKKVSFILDDKEVISGLYIQTKE